MEWHQPSRRQLSLNGLTEFEVRCISAFTFGKAEAEFVCLEGKIDEK